MKRYLFIHNPAANHFRSRDAFRKIQAYIKKEIKNCDFVISESRGDTERVAKERGANYDVVVACGGDGTVRETVSGILELDTCLGIIPMGSGNDYAKSLQIPSVFKQAVALLKNGNISNIDVGECNGIPFVNTLGFGFDGLTNRYASQSKIRNGSLRYVWAALRANSNRDIYQAEIIYSNHPSFSKQVMMITAANGRVEGGSFCIAPKASLRDGRLDFVILEPVSKWLLPWQLPLFLVGKHLRLKSIQVIQTNRCQISFNRPIPIHADGEILESNETEFTVKVLEGKLSVICGL